MKKILFINVLLFIQLLSANAQAMKTHFSSEILGFEMVSDGMIFIVYSGGCTSKEDFRIDILESNPVQVNLVRLAFDPCEAYLPLGQKIKFTWDEMGLRNEQNFFLRNPIGLLTKPSFN